MNLQKAREIIQLNLKEAGSTMPPDVRDALKIAARCITITDILQLTYPEIIGKITSPTING